MMVMDRAQEVGPANRRTRRSGFERLYALTVALKGFDGLIELAAGIVLLFAPSAVRWGLQGGAAEAGEGASPLRLFVAQELIRADRLVAAGVVLLAVVLLVHGLVKVVTVYCLLRRILAAYPWALLVLGGLLVWQVVVLVGSPGVGSAFLAVLDVLVIIVVAREWRLLVAERRRSRETVEEED